MSRRIDCEVIVSSGSLRREKEQSKFVSKRTKRMNKERRICDFLGKIRENEWEKKQTNETCQLSRLP